MPARIFSQPLQALQNGNIATGAHLHVYAEDGITPIDIWTGRDHETPLPNPLIADCAGRFTQFWIDEDIISRVVLETSDGSVIFDADPFVSFPGTVSETLLDDAADPMPFASLEFYDATTTIPANIFADSGLSVPLANPQIADSSGAITLPIWIDDAGRYRLRLLDRNGQLIYDIDDFQVLNVAFTEAPVLSVIGSGNQADLSWTEPLSSHPITGYYIYRRVDGGSWDLLTTGASSPRTYSDVGLTLGSLYEYYVKPFTDFDEGDESNIASYEATVPDVAIVRRSSSYSVVSGNNLIASQSVVSDDTGMWSIADPSVLTIKVAGEYRFGINFQITGLTSALTISLLKNGVTIDSITNSTPLSNWGTGIDTTIICDVADELSWSVNAGGSGTLIVTGSSTRFWAARIAVAGSHAAVSASAQQNVANNGFVVFDTVDDDNGDYFDPRDPDRLTAEFSGYYYVSGEFTGVTGPTTWTLHVKDSAGQELTRAFTNTSSTHFSYGNGIAILTPGMYIRLQNGTGPDPLTVQSGAALSILKVG